MSNRRFTSSARAATVALTLTATPLALAATPPERLPECPPSSADTANLPECQPAPQQEAAPEPLPRPQVKEHRHNLIFAPQEISLVTGAGVGDYFGSPLNVDVDPGAVWDARLTFGAHSIFALEAGYVGSTNSVDRNGSHVGQITSNGLDGTVRLQLPARVQPYVFGGVGYNHMSVDREGDPLTQSQLRHEDNQLTVPAGGGITGYLGRHATVDVRGTYRLIPDNGIIVGDTGSLHQWYAQARIGYTF
jgi:opacity protein-like surface antigen